MKRFGTAGRLVAVFAVLFALSGMRSGAFAQDADGTPATDDTATAAASYYVGVSCWPVGDGSQSACSFSASASDGSAIQALWVPAWVACSDVVDSGGADWTGDGYHVYADSLTLTFAGSVSPGGGAGYVVRVNDTPVDAGGDGLVCSEAPVVTDDSSSNETTGTDGTADESTGDNATDGGTTDDGTADNGTTGDNATDGDAGDNGTAGNGTTDDGSDAGSGDNGTAGDDPSTVTDEATPEAGGDGSVDESWSANETANGSGNGTDEGATAADVPVQVDVSVVVYNCTADPEGDDPATRSDICDPADGVDLSAQDGTTDLGTHPTSGGVYVFFATVGNAFVVSEDVPPGFQPIGNGSATIEPVTASAMVTFVNVANDQGGHTQLGRLQLVHGTCTSREPQAPDFHVIPPRSFQAESTQGCDPTPGAVLTITGDNLPGGSAQVITDGNGVWRGYLPEGLYEISEDGGSVSGVPIVADDLTAVVVIDYVVGTQGSLTVSKDVCTDGPQIDPVIDVSTSPPASGGPSCGPANGEFTISSDSDSTSFSLGNDGVTTMSLPVGTYSLIDLDTGAESGPFDVTENGTTYAVSRSVELQGSLVVEHFFCTDPASNNESRGSSSYWKNQCTQPQGGALTLSDGNGDPVDTRSGKVITWEALDVGTYSVDSDDGLCASFVGNSDSRGGFDVEANTTTHVSVYTCAAPSDGGGGSNSGGNGSSGDGGGDTGGGGDGSGSDGGNPIGGEGTGSGDQTGDDAAGGVDDGSTTGDASDAEEVAGVTQLPDTGTVGSRSDSGLDAVALLALILPALLAGAALQRRRAR